MAATGGVTPPYAAEPTSGCSSPSDGSAAVFNRKVVEEASASLICFSANSFGRIRAQIAMVTVSGAPPYARRSPNRTRTSWVDIKIRHMTRRDADFWHAKIQPDIDVVPNRADSGWSWPIFRTFLPLAQWFKHRRCRALTVLVRGANNRAIPAGMALIIEGYPWIDPKAAVAEAAFTWFISAAPESTLRRLGVPDPPSLGRILIDCGIITSLSVGNLGQMWLHASPKGGVRLANFYSATCHMLNVPKGVLLPPRGRPSDGRHFFVTAGLAKALTNALKSTR